MEDRHDAQFGAAAEGMTEPVPIKGLGAILRDCMAAILIIAAVFSTPALAHKGEKHGQARQAEQVQQQLPNSEAPSGTMPAGTIAEHGPMSGMDGMEMDRSNMSFFERLYSWFGRLHPLVVHFPIAFFPAALFTAVVGRKRPAFAAPVQFLVVAGGIFAPIAAAAGWLVGMDADPEPILAYHRWLGVSVGAAGLTLGIWAWRRPWEDRGAGMIIALTIMTIAIAVQGFLGAGLTHGMDHLMI